MTGFYDMHTHILPKIDDGAKTIDMTMEMIGMAYQQGVRHIVATSHFVVDPRRDDGWFRDYHKDIIYTYNVVKMVANQQYPDMHLYLGNEMMYSTAFPKALQKGWLHTLNDSRYLLVEFFPNTPGRVMMEAMREIHNRGYVMVLAHMERYECLWKNEDQIKKLRDMGVVLQMNVSSVLGGMFDSKSRYCRKLMKKGLIDVLGTDMHNVSGRRPQYDAAAEWILKNCGEQQLLKMSVYNPQAILNNKSI